MDVLDTTPTQETTRGKEKRYSAYKASNVAWLGEIPSHWELLKGKRLFKQMKRPVRDSDEVVTAFRDGIVTLRINRRTEGFTNSMLEIGYQGIRKGDLIIHAMDAFAGAIGVSDSDGKGTPVYAVCTPINSANPYYYAQILRFMAHSGYILSLARGIRERSTDFRFAEFGDLELPVPPPEEQNAIVAFLDRKLAEIDRFIAKKERFIQLLKEQKAAIINRAVTRGLDPDMPMKPSGVEWLGEIPAHWETKKLGLICNRIVDGPHFSPNYVDSGVMFISARNIKTDRWSLEDAKYISPEDYQEFCKRVVPKIGDVLYTKGGTTGIARVVDLKIPFNVWVHVAVLKIKRQLADSYFVAHALNSNACYQQSQLYTRGATNKDLGLTRMANIVMPWPPLGEQHEIVSFIDKQANVISNAITKAEREIELIKEYRTTLISDVVTGKIDVRRASEEKTLV
ncbi:restriction modification system DNA specificity domain-containing protein [Ktedonobacter sp. SOSP1-85]|uniref:restriction endonuclease subunit S n=1 Tax=Ktedonobacter sp. SOSP1-85 TaxID=2778367 RepID=UPI001915496F|nr:restriction endonuclease subunit S [Ktedonobacter sp. SOSP1-85]GHO72601.1 restriction modification system DNA specificity domain-containing protein [Ktedonobacter sp. SOSP1-85]